MDPNVSPLGMSRLDPDAKQDEDINRERPLSSDQTQRPPVDETPLPDLNLSAEDIEAIRGKVIDKLHTCFDPEIPVNIYELGLIYNINIQTTGLVEIDMTLTSPACPVAGSLPGDVQAKVQQLSEVPRANVTLVWEPPWDKSRMSEAAKLQLGIDD
ncbi:MAG: iron-sulfur cluster assembly protein [Gemmataceae bacterium]